MEPGESFYVLHRVEVVFGPGRDDYGDEAVIDVETEEATTRLPHRAYLAMDLDWGCPGNGTFDAARTILWHRLDAEPCGAMCRAFAREVLRTVPLPGTAIAAIEVGLWLDGWRLRHPDLAAA